MKAWHFAETAKPLVPVDLPDPVPGPNEVVLDMRAAGMCHSDVGFWDGTLDSGLDHKPIVLGHENAGIISMLGAHVTDFSVGDRVTAFPIDTPPYPGTGRDGGYAEKTAEPASALIRIPDGVSFEQAAAASDAGMTAYHAVHTTAKAAKGSRVGIIGLGALGMIAARVAVLAGMDVYAADINEDRFAEAAAAGVKASFADPGRLADVEPEVVLDFAGFQSTVLAAMQAVGTGGRVVLVGLGASEISLPTMLFVSSQVELVGSWGGTKEDIADVLDLMTTGQLTIPATLIGFDEISSSLQRLAAGELTGKVIARFGSGS
jgi:2-desacetyl-2-hydroxyethyl bacteriochlorophyllide A dehydrogenase